jgi:hypothetical protein
MFLIFGERFTKPVSSGSSRDSVPKASKNIYFIFSYTESLRSGRQLDSLDLLAVHTSTVNITNMVLSQ